MHPLHKMHQVSTIMYTYIDYSEFVCTLESGLGMRLLVLRILVPLVEVGTCRLAHTLRRCSDQSSQEMSSVRARYNFHCSALL